MNTMAQNHTDEMDICEPWVEERRLTNTELSYEIYRLITEAGYNIVREDIRDILDAETQSRKQSNP